MNADGTGQTRLTRSPDQDFQPAWSPDGSKIAFLSRRHGFFDDIYVMNPDGSGTARLTHSPYHVQNPDWQPIPGPRRGDYKNSAQFCKAEQAFWGDQFASRYGGGANAYGKCVSGSK